MRRASTPPPACSGLGTVENKLGHISTARELLKQTCNDKETFGCDQLGEIERKQGRFADAERAYLAIQEQPCCRPQMKLAELYEKWRKKDKAKPLISQICASSNRLFPAANIHERKLVEDAYQVDSWCVDRGQ